MELTKTTKKKVVARNEPFQRKQTMQSRLIQQIRNNTTVGRETQIEESESSGIDTDEESEATKQSTSKMAPKK
jgi:hypothetical protein